MAFRGSICLGFVYSLTYRAAQSARLTKQEEGNHVRRNHQRQRRSGQSTRKEEGIDPELLTTFKALKVGQAVRLSSTFGEVAKEDRSRVSQVIRKHCRAVREDEMRIDYDTKGVPQVRIKSK